MDETASLLPAPPTSPVRLKKKLVTNMTTPEPKKAAALTPLTDPGFQAYFKKYGKGKWDPVDEHGMSGGYNLYQAYKSGLVPDAAGHLPDHAPGGQVLKSDSDPNAITNGVDNRTGYQVAPPNYTGPMTPEIRANAHKYFSAGTAYREGGPGNWDDIPTGQKRPAKTPPKDYRLVPH